MTKLYTQAHHDHLAGVLLKTERPFASGKIVVAKFAFFPFLGNGGTRVFLIAARKAYEKANKLANHKNPLLHAEVMSYDFADVGNALPDLSYKADS
jgi:hypothetical protein